MESSILANSFFSNRWFLLGVLVTIRTAFGFQFQSVASVSSLMIEDLNINYAEVGTLIGFYMLPGVVIALPSGLLGKRFGDRRVAGYGLALMVVGAVVMGLGGSYPLALAGRLITGVGAVMMNVAVTTMISTLFAGREIRTALGIMLGSWPFGIALGLVVQGLVAEAYSWQVVMHMTAAMSGVSLILLTTVVRISSYAKLSSVNQARFSFLIPWRELVLASLAGIVWAMFNIGFSAHFSFTPDFLVTRGMSSTDAAGAVSIGIWVTMFSVPLGGILTERIGRPNTIIVVFCILAGVTLGLFPHISAAVALSFLIGVAIGPSPPSIVALPAQVVNAENLGPGIGIFFTWYYAGMAIGPAIAGFGRDVTGSAATPLYFGASMFGVAIVFLALFHAAARRYAR
ncbi:MAG: MFS transporter [SAR202 cluster bacterium]|jgi:MFS family permease|nr:MFS transporter [SAR202 cluster bacterium]MDP6514476.1 MFS transporter [SAR202 cluster bacterium]